MRMQRVRLIEPFLYEIQLKEELGVSLLTYSLSNNIKDKDCIYEVIDRRLAMDLNDKNGC